MKQAESKILQARENKQILISKMLEKYKAVIKVQANIPGPNKSIKEAYILTSYYHRILRLRYRGDSHFIDDLDGPCYLIGLANKTHLKNHMVDLEETTPWGRLIDLDVFENSKQSLRRNHMRKCFLCDEIAFVCARTKKHEVNELLGYISKTVKNELQIQIKDLIKRSMMYELNLEDKFGLVTPTSSGSHQDMDYSLMLKAQDAIIDGLVEIFILGYEASDIRLLFKEARKLGLIIEARMLDATKGINAYKGLIFSLGLCLASSGYCLGNNLPFDDIFLIIKKMTHSIMDEFLTLNNTFGATAYHKFGIGGAREEASSGYLTIKKYLNELTDYSDQSLKMMLIKLIATIDDTVFLKRSKSLIKYHQFKQRFSLINEYNEEEIKALSNECIENNLSFGGSADLLIILIYLHLYKETY